MNSQPEYPPARTPPTAKEAATRLCFVHIPKTAGSSVNHALVKIFGKSQTFFWNGEARGILDLPSSQPSVFEHARVLSGHISKPVYEKLPGKKIYATILREPVARAISFFEYAVAGRDESHGLRSTLQQMGILKATKESDHFRHYIANHQCRMICGRPDFSAAIDELEKENWIVGTIDHAQDVIDRLADTMSLPTTPLISDNVSRPGYRSLWATAEVVTEISELNRHDQKLYDFVREKRKAGLVEKLSARLKGWRDRSSGA